MPNLLPELDRPAHYEEDDGEVQTEEEFKTLCRQQVIGWGKGGLFNEGWLSNFAQGIRLTTLQLELVIDRLTEAARMSIEDKLEDLDQRFTELTSSSSTKREAAHLVAPSSRLWSTH